MKTISATEASRRFSDILDLVRHQKETFVILRRGEPVAQIESVDSPETMTTLGEVVSLLEEMASCDPAFADDLEVIQRNQPAPGEPWES